MQLDMYIEYLGSIGYKSGYETNAFIIGLNDTIGNLLIKKKIVLFGAGEDGFMAQVLLEKKGVNIWKYADNNPNLNGRLFNQKEIVLAESLLGEPDVYFIICVAPRNINSVRIQFMANGISEYSIFIRNSSHSFAEEDINLHEIYMQGINKICFENEDVSSALPLFGLPSGNGGRIGIINELLSSSEWWHFGSLWIKKEYQPDQKIRILEIGPGYGLLSYMLLSMFPNASMHWILFGKEQTELINTGYGKRLAKVRLGMEGRITYSIGRIELDYELLKGQYDLVVMTEVFEHFALNPVPTMENIKKVLADEGRMFFTTPNWGHLFTFSSWKRLLSKEEISEDRYYELLQCSHVYQYSKEELLDVLQQSGWEIDKYGLSDGKNHNFLLKKK